MSLLTFILLLSSSLSAAASVIYKGTGSEVVISAGSGLGNIEAVTWKHNEDIAVEWYGGEPSVYRHFIDHTTLDTSTGALTISGLTRDHSGFYTAEINNRIAGTTEIRIISPVSKPTVSMQCDAEMTYCTLTCEGDTTDAEPVTYSWEIFDVLNYYKGQQVNLTKENHDPWYRCEMKNPISSETSEEFPNPFSSGNQTLIIILVLSILFLLLIGLIVGIVIHRKRKGSFSPVKFFRSKTPKSNDQTGSFSLGKFFSPRTPDSNDQTVKEDKGTEEEKTGLLESSNGGVVPAVSIEETSIQIPHTSSVVPDTNTQTALNINEASNPDKTSKKPDDEPENSSKKEEETQVQIHSPETPESNHQTGSFSLMKFLRSRTPESNDQTGSFSLGKFFRSKIPKSNDQTEKSQKKVEEIEVQIHNTETPESNNQTETTSSKGQEVLMSVAETSNESEISPDQVQTSEEVPESSAQTENSPKKDEEVQVQVHISETPESNTQTENSPKKEEEVEVQDHRSETSESNNQTATTTSESQGASMSVAETSNESATDSQDQNTSSNDLQTAASKETEESAEESNGDETTRSLLED